MYILVSDIENTWVPLPWDGAAFFNYKKEDRKYTTKEFLDFLKKEDFLEIKGITVINSSLNNYSFISKCTNIEQVYIYDYKSEVKIDLSNLIYLKQLVVFCEEFKWKEGVLKLLDNKLQNFKQEGLDGMPKLSKYSMADMYIKNIDFKKKEIEEIREHEIFRNELIINGEKILKDYDLWLKEQYIKRQRLLKQIKIEEKENSKGQFLIEDLRKRKILKNSKIEISAKYYSKLAELATDIIIGYGRHGIYENIEILEVSEENKKLQVIIDESKIEKKSAIKYVKKIIEKNSELEDTE